MNRFFLMLLLSVCIIAMAGDENLRPEVNWRPIIGFVSASSNAYVDVNSIQKTSSNSSQYVTGDLLISSKDAEDTVLGGKTYSVRGLVKTILVDCTHELTAPLSDLYFNTALPTRQDKPLVGYVYPMNAAQVRPLDKNSLIYKTFCPVYL